MDGIAGKLNEVYILAGAITMTASTGAKIAGIDNNTYNKLADILEVSAFGDEYKKRIAGMKDSNVSISGNYVNDDTTGQDELEPGDFVMIGIYQSGITVAGKQFPMIIESVEYSADATGKQTISASLQGNGAPVTLPARA